MQSERTDPAYIAEITQFSPKDFYLSLPFSTWRKYVQRFRVHVWNEWTYEWSDQALIHAPIGKRKQILDFLDKQKAMLDPEAEWNPINFDDYKNFVPSKAYTKQTKIESYETTCKECGSSNIKSKSNLCEECESVVSEEVAK